MVNNKLEQENNIINMFDYKINSLIKEIKTNYHLIKDKFEVIRESNIIIYNFGNIIYRDDENEQDENGVYKLDISGFHSNQELFLTLYWYTKNKNPEIFRIEDLNKLNLNEFHLKNLERILNKINLILIEKQKSCETV